MMTKEHGKYQLKESKQQPCFGFMPLLSSIAAVDNSIGVRFIVCVAVCLFFKNKPSKWAQLEYNVTMIFDTLIGSVIWFDLKHIRVDMHSYIRQTCVPLQ